MFFFFKKKMDVLVKKELDFGVREVSGVSEVSCSN